MDAEPSSAPADEPAPAAAAATRLPPCASCAAPSKYRCPRCAVASCSAACVAAHKAGPRGGGAGGGCSGRRDVAAFVGLRQFSDAQLRADYTFLEEAGRVAERAKRAREELPGKGGAGRGARLQTARVAQRAAGIARDRSGSHGARAQAAKLRGTEVVCQSAGMARREANKSTVDSRTQARCGVALR